MDGSFDRSVARRQTRINERKAKNTLGSAARTYAHALTRRITTVDGNLRHGAGHKFMVQRLTSLITCHAMKRYAFDIALHAT